MTKKYVYIYKCTYLKNNKIYIGQKTGDKIQDGYYDSGVLWVSEVLDKCNKEKDIKRDVLEWCYSNEELNDREKYWINYYDSTNPDIGYNIMRGGGPFNKKYRQDMSNTISNIMETTNAKEKISNSLKKYRKCNPFSEEHRRKLSEKAKGNTNGKKQQQITTIAFDKNNTPIRKVVYTSCQSRNIEVYCILDNGETYNFKSIREAGIWWHETFNPFKHYSACVYQRKILKAINENIIFYYNKQNRKKEYIINIKWFLGRKEREEVVI